MKVATTAAFATIALASAALAQGKGVERLYILECGQGHTGDMSRWTPGQNVNVPIDIVDNCYLIKHAPGLFPVGHRYPRFDTDRQTELRRSQGADLAASQDAGCPAHRAWRQARRHQICRHIAHPSRSHWQC